MSRRTGWIKYWVAGKGGHGYQKWKWVFAPGYDEDKDTALELIISNHESWAQHAEYYSGDIQLGLMPPTDRIKAEIENKRSNVRFLAGEISELMNQYEEQKNPTELTPL